MAFHSKYGLELLDVGEAKAFHDLTPIEHERLRRSAHNFNKRTTKYFTTRSKDGVVYVTRVR